MNKKAIEKFAVQARKQLLEAVTLRAALFGISKSKIEAIEQESSDSIVIHGQVYPIAVKAQRQRLIEQIKAKGFDAVMEECAYTWFNRFIALRFMEVNDYLPTGVRVFSSHDPEKKQPDLLTHALEIGLSVNKEEIYRLQQNHRHEDLYKLLVLTQCNALAQQLPFLFEKVADYTELLFPANLLAKESVTQRMVTEIEEEDWKEVEIIGWLYQFYISEKKDDAIKAKKKYKNAQIPVVTQLFTPKWLVQYMVDNSLGRAWLEANPQSSLQQSMEFYIQPRNNQDTAKPILAGLNPEKITILDPACGSGHILAYAFDVLYQIYLEKGYETKSIPSLILEKNLFGLDIDERAIQLTCFALCMKARSKARKILNHPIKMNVWAFTDSSDVETLERSYTQLIKDFQHGTVVGSLIKPQANFEDSLLDQPVLVEDTHDIFTDYSKWKLNKLVLLSDVLSAKYHFVITNPPYIGGKYFNDTLGNYIKTHYPNTKADLFSAFMERCFSLLKEGGYVGLVTPFVWMFIQSYEWLRDNLIKNFSILSLVKPEYHFFFDSAFVPLVSFVLRKSKQDFTGEFIDLSHARSYEEHIAAFKEAIQNPNTPYRYTAHTADFSKIPGSPIAYWVSDKVRNLFLNLKIREKYEVKEGLGTRDDERFIKSFWEVDFRKIGTNKKWIKTDKAGGFRKWYNDFCYVMNWENNGFEIKNL